jgi:hypothetical protein
MKRPLIGNVTKRPEEKSKFPPKDDHSLWLLPQPLKFGENHGWLYRNVEPQKLEEPRRPKTSNKNQLADWKVLHDLWKKERDKTKWGRYVYPDMVFLKFLGHLKNKRPVILHMFPESSTELLGYNHWLGERELVIHDVLSEGFEYDFIWVRLPVSSSLKKYQGVVERAVVALKAGGSIWVDRGRGVGDDGLLGCVQGVLGGSLSVVVESDLGWGLR